MRKKYEDQVKLLLNCMPQVAKEKAFALKGGTAINLFVVDNYPRVSVDIDLTYIHVKDREVSLKEINDGLESMATNIERFVPGAKVIKRNRKDYDITYKLDVLLNGATVRIEPNLVLRGVVYEPRKLSVSDTVQKEYSLYAGNVPVVSNEDLFAGKICAALDRQHPRDLFDVRYILDNGFSEKLKYALIYYLCSSNRPLHELISPNKIGINEKFVNEFSGMSNVSTTLACLEKNRDELFEKIVSIWNGREVEFFVSFCLGKPDYGLIPIGFIEKMPSIKWMQYNIARMSDEKMKVQVKKLQNIFRVGG